MIVYLLAVLNILMASLAQMMLKRSANTSYGRFYREYLNGWVIGGYSLLGLSLLINIYFLGHGLELKSLSILESFSYLFIPLFSFIFFREKINKRKAASILVIIIGIVVFFS